MFRKVMAVFTAVTVWGAVESAASVTLMEGGSPAATIILPDKASKAEQNAAKELQSHLWQMAGGAERKARKLEMRTETQGARGTKIYIKRTVRPQELNLGLESLANHGFKIRSVEDGLVLCGKDDLGTEYAVYTFLEKNCDVRWFWPGELGQYVPRRPTVRVGRLRETHEPAFELTRLGRKGPWRKRNKLLRHFSTSGGHSWGRMLPPAKYGPTHPEYYALVKGTRERDWNGYNGQHAYQLCTSNPEVIRLSIEDVRRRFDRDPKLRMYCVGANDGGGFCECEPCVALGVGRAKDQKDPTQPIMTDRIWAYTNAIARAIKKSHPDRRLVQFAYSYYADPPRKEKPEDNVVPWLALNCEGDYDPAYRKVQRQRIRAWSKLSRRLFIYEYFNHTWKLNLPRAMPKAIGEAIPFYRKCGATLFTGQSGNDFATEGLNYYLAAKLLWDPSQNVNALVDDYCRKAFGKAAPVMKKYFERLEQRWAASVQARTGARLQGTCEQYEMMFTPEAARELKGYLTEAERMAEEGKPRRRVQFILRGWRFGELELAAFGLLRQLAAEGVLRKFHPAGWKSKAVVDLSALKTPESRWRPLILKTIAAWEERDRYVEKCKGAYVIDVRFLRAWNCTNYRFHPVAPLKKALTAYDRARAAKGPGDG